MAHYFNLLNGQRVPSIGLGTYAFDTGHVSTADSSSVSTKEDPATTKLPIEEMVKQAIASGYRHIDCAHAYNNEQEVGRGIKRAMDEYGIPRYGLNSRKILIWAQSQITDLAVVHYLGLICSVFFFTRCNTGQIFLSAVWCVKCSKSDF